ncbi:MAG: 3,4-dihydroxy-2-butanone-4-phosphate synthase [Planctomycetota bacterium]
MNPIPDILDDLRQGKIVLLIDDEQRENEGDLIAAAEHATPDVVNFMLREGRGMLFASLDGAGCDRLDLPPQAAVNTSQRTTAYTITVDAADRHGVTTGVSAGDRSTTIQLLADPTATPADFDRPGHIQPLRARDGGVLVRTGHTEASVDLCRLAGLAPAAVGIEVMNADGSMARADDLRQLAETHGLRMCSVDDVIAYRLERDRLIERVAEQPFTNDLGTFDLIAYRSAVDPMPHVVLTCGGLGKHDRGLDHCAERDEPVLVRMHSQNLLTDVFGDARDPRQQPLRTAMRMIQERGCGAIVYLRHEGMGRGLVKHLQTDTRAGQDDPDRPRFGQSSPSPGPDSSRNQMDYGIGSQVLRDLGIRRLELITDHPFTPTALSGFGLSIERFVPISSAE